MWEMQVYIPKNQHEKPLEWHWRSIRPTGGEPYRYNTKEEAERMLDMCYPAVMMSPPYDRRVIKVED